MSPWLLAPYNPRSHKYVMDMTYIHIYVHMYVTMKTNLNLVKEKSPHNFILYYDILSKGTKNLSIDLPSLVIPFKNIRALESPCVNLVAI